MKLEINRVREDCATKSFANALETNQFALTEQLQATNAMVVTKADKSMLSSMETTCRKLMAFEAHVQVNVQSVSRICVSCVAVSDALPWYSVTTAHVPWVHTCCAFVSRVSSFAQVGMGHVVFQYSFWFSCSQQDSAAAVATLQAQVGAANTALRQLGHGLQQVQALADNTAAGLKKTATQVWKAKMLRAALLLLLLLLLLLD